jgi:hypothetical protein
LIFSSCVKSDSRPGTVTVTMLAGLPVKLCSLSKFLSLAVAISKHGLHECPQGSDMLRIGAR